MPPPLSDTTACCESGLACPTPKSFVGLLGSSSQFSFVAVPGMADDARVNVVVAGGVSPAVVTNFALSPTAIGDTTLVVESQAPVARRVSVTPATPGRYVEASGKSNPEIGSNSVMVNAAIGGSWIWMPPASVEERHPGRDPGHVPGFVTV